MTHSFLRRFTTLFLFREQQESLPHSLGFLNPIPVSELLHKRNIYEGDSEKLFTHVQGPIKHLDKCSVWWFPSSCSSDLCKPGGGSCACISPSTCKGVNGILSRCFHVSYLQSEQLSIDTPLITYRIMMSFAGTLDCFILFFSTNSDSIVIQLKTRLFSAEISNFTYPQEYLNRLPLLK